MLDQFMGGCVVLGSNNPFGGDSEAGDRQERTMELYKRGKKQDEEMGGNVKIIIGEVIMYKAAPINRIFFKESTDDLMAL